MSPGGGAEEDLRGLLITTGDDMATLHTRTETTEKVVLRIEIVGGVSLAELRLFLGDLDTAHTSLVAFERLADRVQRRMGRLQGAYSMPQEQGPRIVGLGFSSGQEPVVLGPQSDIAGQITRMGIERRIPVISGALND
jgi:hypothetical protein